MADNRRSGQQERSQYETVDRRSENWYTGIACAKCKQFIRITQGTFIGTDGRKYHRDCCPVELRPRYRKDPNE